MIGQRKIASREENILAETNKERASWLFFLIGIIVSLIGYVVYDFHINQYVLTQTGRKVLIRSEYPYQSAGLFLIILGLVILLIGIVKKIYSRLKTPT